MVSAVILLWINIMLYFDKDRLSAYLKAITVWTLYMFLGTEILSFARKLDFMGLIMLWLILDIILFSTVVFGKRLDLKNYREWGGHFFCKIKSEFKWHYIVLALIAFASLYFAIKTRPYNWDSMTYHLSRVAHWSMNKSVGHYSTNIVRQVASPVLAEFVVTHIYVLCKGNDIFVNVVQSTAFVTNAIIVYGIAKKLKCKSKYCFLASFLYMTAPIAFAESVTTQVDDFAALWMLIFVYFMIDFMNINCKVQYNRETIGSVAVLGCCVAFGYLCKPSVSISMAIFASWFLIICLVRRDRLSILFRLVIYALPGMLIPMGIEIGRNLYTFGRIASSITGQRQLIGTLRPNYVFVNCIKNISFNLPNIYDANSQQKILNFVHKLATALHVMINDPSISEDGVEFKVLPARTYGMDSAINPIIVTLTLLCIVWIIYRYKRGEILKVQTGFSVVSIITFIIFCAVLRWESFISRYMISYLALLCITVCVQIQSVEEHNRYRNLSYAIVGIIYFCSFVEIWGLVGFNKSMCERGGALVKEESYFLNRTGEYKDYAFAVDYIRKNDYKKVGFLCGEDHYEYPLIKMLEDHIEKYEHVGVNNETLKYEDGSYIPDCIFVIGQDIQDSYVYHGVEYQIAYDYGEGWKYILTHE